MVEPLIADIFESKAQTLVNTVNCVGVMGKGIALGFRKRFPDMHEDYQKLCAQGKVWLGRPYLYRRVTPPWILNFPTKAHWRSVARLSDIIKGLEYLEQHYQAWGITSLAVPPLGCGQGQLDWQVVGPTLYRHLSRLDITVELYAPHGTPPEQLEPAFLTHQTHAPRPSSQAGEGFRINPAWVGLVEILARIVREPYHWPVGRTTFQKIAYFATELGLPTGLHYSKGSYGPFTTEFKTVVTRLVNNGLVSEDQLGRMFSVKPGPTYHDAIKLFRPDLARWEPIIDRVADLFLRMKTSQAEVAATVVFATRSLERHMSSKPSEAAVLEEVRRWKQRRRPPLDESEAAQTIRNLNILGWLNLQASPEMLPIEDVPTDS